MAFELVSPFQPCGDQPAAIAALNQGLAEDKKAQVLLGITGSGKTFTMANVIQNYGRPTLILAHNKTLAAQLYEEFKSFFPNNAVEYFVSYYDYYQPEAYIARSDTYIEKDLSINEQIDRMRLSATRALLEREDVIIVASVSCIYGLGMPQNYIAMRLELSVGMERRRDEILLQLVHMQYKRSEDLTRCYFRVRGEVLEIFPAYEEDLAYRIEFFGDEVEKISEIDPLTGHVKQKLEKLTIYPSSHHVTPEEVQEQAILSIKEELRERLDFFDKADKPLEKERLLQRSSYDIECIEEMGFCKGIENYSRHFDQRLEGQPPSCLLDYFPEDYLLIVDESHQTIPQLHAMYNGDRSRKASLVDFGFRLPSAFDNRPLRFEESYQKFGHAIYVSATPAKWEVEEAGGEVVEQIIRPTGLIDPPIEIKPVEGQVDDVMEQIRLELDKGGRVLVTTLTKRMAEELSNYLQELGIKVRYLHSDVGTVERVEILNELRLGEIDVLVGINLLREGLDLPEVTLVAILDADKEGFLRSETALIQTCGRAARNSEGRVIMYADRETGAIKGCLETTSYRRERQEHYNQEHGITPQTVKKKLSASFTTAQEGKETDFSDRDVKQLDTKQVHKKIKEYEKEMKKAAKEYRFEEAAKFRDLLRHYQHLELDLS